VTVFLWTGAGCHSPIERIIRMMVLRGIGMRKHLAIIAALLLAAAVLGVLAAAPMSLSYG
jgi:hypothetical protein